MSTVKQTNNASPIINTSFWLRITAYPPDTDIPNVNQGYMNNQPVGVDYAEDDPRPDNAPINLSDLNLTLDNQHLVDPNTKEDLASVKLDMHVSKQPDETKAVPGSVTLAASIVPAEETKAEVSNEPTAVSDSVALDINIGKVEEVASSVALETRIDAPAVKEQRDISKEKDSASVTLNMNVSKQTNETKAVPGSVTLAASIVPAEETKTEVSNEPTAVSDSVALDINIGKVEEVASSVVLETRIDAPAVDGDDTSNAAVDGDSYDDDMSNASVDGDSYDDDNYTQFDERLTRMNFDDPILDSSTEVRTSGQGGLTNEPSNVVSSGIAQYRTPYIRDIGLQGTVYFYVNQNANTPLLMSGEINHYFEVKDTKIRGETNLPIQITHNITQTRITSNAPFNATVKINGNLCIGENVYKIESGDTIDVSNIVHIPPLPDSHSTIGKPGNTFFQKYFEYSGKIYMDGWSSKIHWCTFYNPDNYKVSRELPTKNDTNGVFGNSNWALYQRKINMYIGKITVMNDVEISPPPFSIDMQMTSESTSGGGFGKIDEPNKNEGIPLFIQLLQSTSPEFKKELLKKIATILHNVKNNKLNDTEILNTITTQIIKPLVNEASDTNKQKSNRLINQLRTKTKELLRTHPDLLMNIITQVNQPPKHPVVDNLRKPNNVIQVKISGNLTTSFGETYGIQHIIFLSYESREVKDETSNITKTTDIYTAYKIEKDDVNVPHSQHAQTTKKVNTKTFYVQGNFGVDPSSPFEVVCRYPLRIVLDQLTESDNPKANQHPTPPSLHISHLHIYRGNRQIQNRNPLYSIRTEPFQLHKDSNNNTNDKDVLCDFSSNITVTKKTITNKTIDQTHVIIEYEAIIPEVISPKQNDTKRDSIKGGGRRTRRFRRKCKRAYDGRFTI